MSRAVMLDMWNSYLRTAQAGLDAYTVIALRMMRLAGGGALAQREAQRMVAEKVGAFYVAQAAAAAAAMRGQNAGAAANAASRVYRRKVKANRRRLSRRRRKA